MCFFLFYSLSLLFVLLFNQAVLAADVSLIHNGDFSKINQKGNPIGWSCACRGRSSMCDLKPNLAGGALLTLRQGCSLSSSSAVLLPNNTQGVTMDVTTNRAPLRFQDFTLATFNSSPESNMTGVRESAHVVTVTNHSAGFKLHTSSVSSNNANVAFIVINNLEAQPIVIKKIDVLQGGENPATKTAALLKITHLTYFKLLSNAQDHEIWLPLPLDYATQTPLWVNLKAEPLSAITSVRYTQDTIGNWGAIVKLNSAAISGTIFRLQWEGVVLTRLIDDSERAEIYRAETNPDTWLQRTAVAESNDPNIIRTTQKIIKNSLLAADKMINIITWGTKNITHVYDNPLDASSVFKARAGSCTGHANLTSAMGRIAEIPTRSIANFYIGVGGTPQQTHFVNELYLGSDLGWRRVEPQSELPFLTEDYGVMMRIITLEDEGEKSFQEGRKWSWPGVPDLSIVMDLDRPYADIKVLSDQNIFPDCSDCDNRGENWSDLHGTLPEMKQLFTIARSNWQFDMRSYLTNGNIDVKRQAIRATALSIQNTQDLTKFLTLLNQAS